jgi:hypothetical protein
VQFQYPCPNCRTTTSLHAPDCRFDGTPWHEIETAYVDILSTLATGAMREGHLRERSPGRWDRLHSAALSRLRSDQRVHETSGGALELLSPAAFREQVAVPSQEPLQIIYEEGSVPGCHDHALFALIAYYEMVGFSWAETRERVVDWLRESGAWSRGGFEESSPEAAVENKRHVYVRGYGWRQAAEEAAAVIQRRG